MECASILSGVWKGTSFSEDETKALLEKWPQFEYCCEKVRNFRGIIKNRNLDGLLSFILEIESDDTNIFHAFAVGLVKDIDAVKNALIYEYSNGLLEGHINKLKVKKRMMYGRAGYELLRKKVLYLDTLI